MVSIINIIILWDHRRNVMRRKPVIMILYAESIKSQRTANYGTRSTNNKQSSPAAMKHSFNLIHILYQHIK